MEDELGWPWYTCLVSHGGHVRAVGGPAVVQGRVHLPTGVDSHGELQGVSGAARGSSSRPDTSPASRFGRCGRCSLKRVQPRDLADLAAAAWRESSLEIWPTWALQPEA